jgi:hypothetical protein
VSAAFVIDRKTIETKNEFASADPSIFVLNAFT